MPIHINLLAEAQAAEEMRRHDPVKRGIFIGMFLTALCFVWSGIVELNVIVVKGRSNNVQMTINSKTNAYQHVLSNEKKIMAAQKKLAALQNLQASRFLQGNLLDALQHATVEGVQLTRLREDQAYFLTEGTQTQTNDDRVILGRPATVKEKIIMHLDARDYSPNPGDKVNKFKEAVARQSYFQAMLEKTNAVQLASSPSAPQAEGGKQFVTFTLDCRYHDKVNR